MYIEQIEKKFESKLHNIEANMNLVTKSNEENRKIMLEEIENEIDAIRVYVD